MGPNGLVHDQFGMINIAVDFYKKLFAKDSREDFTLQSDFWDTDGLVTEAENSLLTAPFSEEEIKDAVFNSYAEGAPGPDGLSFLFYQKFWGVVKHDLVKLFDDFYSGNLDLHRLNFAMISLIPKVAEAKDMKNFRPISLINCSFKIFSKVLTSRLARVADRLVDTNQSAFYQG